MRREWFLGKFIWCWNRKPAWGAWSQVSSICLSRYMLRVKFFVFYNADIKSYDLHVNLHNILVRWDWGDAKTLYNFHKKYEISHFPPLNSRLCVHCCSICKIYYSSGYKISLSNKWSGTVLTLHIPGLSIWVALLPSWRLVAGGFFSNSAHPGTDPTWWHCLSGFI